MSNTNLTKCVLTQSLSAFWEQIEFIYIIVILYERNSVRLSIRWKAPKGEFKRLRCYVIDFEKGITILSINALPLSLLTLAEREET